VLVVLVGCGEAVMVAVIVEWCRLDDVPPETDKAERKARKERP
jgi:hypothetical protein